LLVAITAALTGFASIACAQEDKPKTPEAQPDAPKPATPKPAVQPPRQPNEVKLNLGDPAPELKVEKWIKGNPVTGFDKNKTYVVEFWATWCGPCIKNMPHLTELQEKYKNVRFIGVSIWESAKPVQDGTYVDRVRDFVKDQGETMGYTVAFGGDEAPMAKTWMDAAGQNGIPCAFIVNGEGKVAWIGHPAQMDKPLADIVAGNYDIKGATEKTAKAAATAKRQRQLAARLDDAVRNGNTDEQLKTIDELVELDPDRNEPLIGAKFTMMLIELKDEKGAYEYARKVSAGAAKDRPQALNSISWTILDNDGVAHRDYDLALKIAQAADEASKHENAAITDTLARAYFETGDVAKAGELEAKAISLLKPGEEPLRADMEAALKKYKAAKK
jgi:thiol-disulfide isomerase/thioredoxin